MVINIGLENRSRGNSTGGSNPPLSATIQTLSLTAFNDPRHTWYVTPDILVYSVGIRTGSLSYHHHLLISSKQHVSVLKKSSLRNGGTSPVYDIRRVARLLPG